MLNHYYNEHNPTAVAWLHELMRMGLIPKGFIDDRDIQEVRADDLRGFIQCHFFAGIGGWPLALQFAGWNPDRLVWTGSCPCQPFSVAGRGKGFDDERHVWPAWFKLICEFGDKYGFPTIFGEQVAGKDGRKWLAGVRTNLEGVAYEFGAADLCVAGVRAPHIRQRFYWVAKSPDCLRACYTPGKGWGLAGRAGRPILGWCPQQRFDRPGNARWIPDLHDEERQREQVSEQPRRQDEAVPHLDGSGTSGGLQHAGRAGCEEQRRRDGEPEGLATAGSVGGICESEGQGPPERGLQREADGAHAREGLVVPGDTRGLSVSPGSEQQAGELRSREEEAQQEPAVGVEQCGDGGRADASTDNSAAGLGFWDDYDILPYGDGRARRVEPESFPLAHGVSGRVAISVSVQEGAATVQKTHWYSRTAALVGFGNAIVPELAAEFVIAAVEAGA